MKLMNRITIIVVCLLILYSTLTKSRKQFIKNLLSQAPYLIPRYFT